MLMNCCPVAWVSGNLPRQEYLGNLDVDSYVEEVVAKTEDHARPPAPVTIRQLGRVTEEVSDGPFTRQRGNGLLRRTAAGWLHCSGSYLS